MGVSDLKNELPGEFTVVVQRLLEAEDVFGFDTSGRIEVWQPTDEEFRRICSATEFRDRALVRQLIWESVNWSTRSVREFAEESEHRKTTDYAAAREELLRTIARAREIGFDAPEVTRRLEAFNRSFDKSIVDALIADALSAADPVARSLLMLTAEMMEHWHKTNHLVRWTQEGISQRDLPCEEALHPEQLKERLKIVDAVVKLHRELVRDK